LFETKLCKFTKTWTLQVYMKIFVFNNFHCVKYVYLKLGKVNWGFFSRAQKTWNHSWTNYWIKIKYGGRKYNNITFLPIRNQEREVRWRLCDIQWEWNESIVIWFHPSLDTSQHQNFNMKQINNENNMKFIHL
jgi:hypothetical protein